MDQAVLKNVQVLWDYMHMNMEPQKADVIVGFGCYGEEIALRAAELYFEGYAPKILFTGGLGRVTKHIWKTPEADRFGALAEKAGVPRENILIENRSANSGENILFTREILEPLGVKKILGVHKPFMERRVYAAMGAYWPEVAFTVTSPQLTLREYLDLSESRNLPASRVIEILAGDYQRIRVYAEKGFQTPQPVSREAEEAFQNLVALGFTGELVK